MSRAENVYALYKGDVFIDIGTKKRVGKKDELGRKFYNIST